MKNLYAAIAAFAIVLPACSSAGDVTGPGSPAVKSKADEISDARNGPTARQISGNAEKWSGRYVRIHCKIVNVIGDEANAECGEGVTVSFHSSMPNIDYSDPDAVNKALQQQQEEQNHMMSKVEDQAMLVLAGTRTSGFDGGQLLTIIGPVLGTIEGKNGMGATEQFPTVRVDYAE